uniref:CCHC-type domain-containing protein n=1 Tax=Chenopodium quinoa TaxID=63459 RepID=A0A803L0T6_CHEQI
MRIKVKVDIRKPLRRGLFISTGGSKPKWIVIKYERLGDFCFSCGKLNHIDKDCIAEDEDEEEGCEVVYQYGAWLRASPSKQQEKSFSLREKERK